MWADSTFEDLVQYNDGFRTQLIGTPEQIAERIAAYRKRGVDLILGGFLHFQEEIEYFGARVLPLVREIEAAEADSVTSGADLRLSAANAWCAARRHRGCASVGRASEVRAVHRRSVAGATSSTGEVMTYPPGNPGYPPAQPPRRSTARRPTVRNGRARPAAPAGPSTAAAVPDCRGRVLGWRVYLASFGPVFTSGADFPFTPTLLAPGSSLAIAAGCRRCWPPRLLPKQKAIPARASRSCRCWRSCW